MCESLATESKVTESTLGIKMGESLWTESQVLESKLEKDMDP
jgi:hypothetical protein